MNQGLEQQLQLIGDLLIQCEWMLATAESCTGGGVAQAVTSISGSSRWFERGFVTYSNLAKQQMLGVSEAILQEYGAVSEPVARAMAEGALNYSTAHLGLAITGIAGPDGGSEDKPVGTVWFAWAIDGQATISRCCHLSGDRASVREQAIKVALAGVLEILSGEFTDERAQP